MNKLLLLMTSLALLSGCLTPRAMQESKQARELGVAYLSEGNDSMAVTELKKAVKKNRWDHEAWHALGLAYYSGGHHELAADAFGEALELNPAYSQAKLNLGSLYIAMERWDDAIAITEEALSDPEYREPGRARNNLAWAHFNKGEYPQARARYREVLRQYSSFCPAIHGLGMVDEAEGKLKDALARYQQAVECNPSDLNALASLGIVEARLDLVGDACQHLTTVRAADPYGDLKTRTDPVFDTLDCDSVSKL